MPFDLLLHSSNVLLYNGEALTTDVETPLLLHNTHAKQHTVHFKPPELVSIPIYGFSLL